VEINQAQLPCDQQFPAYFPVLVFQCAKIYTSGKRDEAIENKLKIKQIGRKVSFF